MAAQEYRIVQGPDRLDLVIAYANYHNMASVYFSVMIPRSLVYERTHRGEEETRVIVSISGLQHATDLTWNIDGLVRAPNFIGICPSRFNIRYNPSTKKGALRFLTN